MDLTGKDDSSLRPSIIRIPVVDVIRASEPMLAE